MITEVTIKGQVYQLKDIPETHYLCPKCDKDVDRECLAAVNEKESDPLGFGSDWTEICQCLECKTIFQFKNSD